MPLCCISPSCQFTLSCSTFLHFCSWRKFVLFPQHIFLMEQNEYKEEGIRWETISFKDNKPILVDSLSSSILHHTSFLFLFRFLSPSRPSVRQQTDAAAESLAERSSVVNPRNRKCWVCLRSVSTFSAACLFSRLLSVFALRPLNGIRSTHEGFSFGCGVCAFVVLCLL